MANANTIDRALKGLGSTMVSAKELVRKATVDFGHAHEPRHKLIVSTVTMLVCFALLVPLLFGGEDAAIEHVEKPLQSARVRLLEDNTRRDPDIVIINIDDAALAYGDWPDFGQGGDTAASVHNGYAWPWPRSVYNKIIRYCRESGARVIVFDLLFSETGPNTNQPRRVTTTEAGPIDVWTYDKAGDDLFILEATAKVDVVVALMAERSDRKKELRDELLRGYSLPVTGVSKDRLLEGLQRVERFGPYVSGAVPFAGLLDGVPDLLSDARAPEMKTEERLEYLRQYEGEVNANPDLKELINMRSLLPVAGRDAVHGVGGVGLVNVFPDIDGRVRAFDLTGLCGSTQYASLPLEAFRLLVLSYAREAQAGAKNRADFTLRFPGLELSEKGLLVDGVTYSLSRNLRDVPLVVSDGQARYMGREFALDTSGRMQLRYRNFLNLADLPAYRRDPEGYTRRGFPEKPFAVYPSVSARDVLRDYDARHLNLRAKETQAEILRLEKTLASAPEPEKADLAKQLKDLQSKMQSLPAKPIELAMGEFGDLLKDKVVFIAGSAAGLYDAHATPLDPNTPGTWIVATAFDNLRNADVMHEQSRWQVWLISLLAVALGVNLTFYAGKTRYALLGVGLVALALVGTGWLAFSLQHWFHLSAPLSALFIGFAGGSLGKALTEGRQKAHRESFARQYMGTELVDFVIKRPQALQLGGVNREMTIYFSDVAGFTTVTETLGPEHPDRLVELLNIYLERMTDIMLESGGVIDKYIGDAIMCFWGAPREMQDHAVRACKGALACKSEMSRMQPLFADAVRATAPQLIKPDGTVLSARAGINTGIVTVGNMGSSKRFAYTVMGDAVNLASRLEGQNKEYGSWIMLGENTEKLIRGEFVTRRLDLLVVKGKTKPTQVFELLGPKDVPQFILDLVRDFERGIENFRNREFAHALEWFKTSLQNEPDKDASNPSALYIERCETFLETPPPADWNGVFVKKSK